MNGALPDLPKIGQTKPLCAARIEHGSFPINFSDRSGLDILWSGDNPLPLGVKVSASATVNSQGSKFITLAFVVEFDVKNNAKWSTANLNLNVTLDNVDYGVVSKDDNGNVSETWPPHYLDSLLR